MKALSMKQPWANLIASGKKTIETLKWKTRYRGNLLIVSSKKPNIEPAGCAVAVVTLVDCRDMIIADEEAACCRLYPCANAWVLSNIKPVEPFPVKGELGIFDVDLDERFLPYIIEEPQYQTVMASKISPVAAMFCEKK